MVSCRSARSKRLASWLTSLASLALATEPPFAHQAPLIAQLSSRSPWTPPTPSPSSRSSQNTPCAQFRTALACLHRELPHLRKVESEVLDPSTSESVVRILQCRDPISSSIGLTDFSKLTCWACGANLPILRRKTALSHQIGEPKSTETRAERGSNPGRAGVPAPPLTDYLRRAWHSTPEPLQGLLAVDSPCTAAVFKSRTRHM